MKKVFISYAHEDEAYKDQLKKHLKPLVRQKKLEIWDDRSINAGTEWNAEIHEAMQAAEIMLLLISNDFINSDFIFDVELKHGLERHAAGTARVIPIILRDCDWTEMEFAKLQALPKNAKPIATFENEDEAYTFIAKQIRKLL